MTPAELATLERRAETHLGSHRAPKPNSHLHVALLDVLALVAEVRRLRRLEQPARVPASAFERWQAAGCPGVFEDWARNGEGQP